MDDIAGRCRGTDPIFVQCAGHHPGLCIACFGGDLSVCQTLYLVAAGVFGACVQLGGIDDLCRSFDAHQDREDDALIGVKSTARLFADRTPTWLFAFSILSAILLGIATYLACAERGALSTLVAMLVVPAFWMHLRWQMQRFDAHDPIRLMMLFRSNRDAGLVVVLFFAIAAML